MERSLTFQIVDTMVKGLPFVNSIRKAAHKRFLISNHFVIIVSDTVFFKVPISPPNPVVHINLHLLIWSEGLFLWSYN